MALSPSSGKEGDIVSLDERSRILHRPEMYVGTIKPSKAPRWVLRANGKGLHLKEVTLSDALLKIVDEVISNASDHCARLADTKAKYKVTDIAVSINKESGEVTVRNNGEGITTAPDASGIYQAQRGFSIYGSSRNYMEKSKGSMVGVHGLGVKLTTTLSSWLTVESVDSVRGERFTQKYVDNLDPTKTSPPKIEPYKGAPYTKVTFVPDFNRFGIKGFTDDIIAVIHARVASMTTFLDPKVTLSFNDKPFAQRGLRSFVELVEGVDFTEAVSYKPKSNTADVFWEVIATPVSEDALPVTMSFVNGGITRNGGTHLDFIRNKLSSLVIAKAKSSKAEKWQNLKPGDVRDAVNWFVFMNIHDPHYPSQAKVTWEGDVSEMPPFPDPPKSLVDKMFSYKRLEDIVDASAAIKAKKTNAELAGKVTAVVNIDPTIYVDANMAGRKGHAEKCSLILCEGNSALANARAVIGTIKDGRDYYGALALKGKPLNVMNATSSAIVDNAEITALHKALGLNPANKYENGSGELRYGKILLLLDFDLDGIGHIAPLVLNIFFHMYPRLFKTPNFVQYVITPLLKVFHKANKKPTVFYNIGDYHKWKEAGHLKSSDEVKYYKGIATSSGAETAQCFTTEKRFLNFDFGESVKANPKGDDTLAMNLLFHKDLADMRKDWLKTYDEDEVIDYANTTNISFKDFIDRGAKHYAIYTMTRAIPHVMDGLKDSQRKIVYGLLKITDPAIDHTSKKGLRVAQLSGYVSKEADYHHGEASLNEAITKMGQIYVGSNNINLIKPAGQFGTRDVNGADAGQPRYINAHRSEILKIIFDARDDIILKQNENEGKIIEPKYYLPIIPMLLVNGAAGIATGYSTNIPQYNPFDLIDYLANKLKGKPNDVELVPFVRGHKGLVFKDSTNKFSSKGVWSWNPKDGRLTITEIPIGISINDYILSLRELTREAVEARAAAEEGGAKAKAAAKATAKATAKVKAKAKASFKKKGVTVPYIETMRDVSNESTPDAIKIVVRLTPYAASQMQPYSSAPQEEVAKMFNLWSEPSELRTSNMHALSIKYGGIRKYATAEELIDEYYTYRLEGYVERRQAILDRDIERLSYERAVIRYIQAVINGDIVLDAKLSVEYITSKLNAGKYPLKDGSFSYLINDLGFSAFYAANLAARIKKADALSADIEMLKSKTAKRLWLEDLKTLDESLPEDLYFDHVTTD